MAYQDLIGSVPADSPQYSISSTIHRIERIFFCISALSLFAWAELVGKDWLVSSVEPYPYVASTLTTLAAITALVALLAIRGQNEYSYFVLCIVGIALLWHECLEVGSFGSIFIILATVGIAALLMFSAKNKAKSPIGCAFIGTVASINIMISGLILFPSPIPHLSSNSWIGYGLGALRDQDAAYISESFRSVLIGEQGLIMPFILILMIASASILAAAVLLGDRAKLPNMSAHKKLAAMGMSTLFGLLTSSHGTSPFMTVTSTAGTWVLAFSITSIGIAAKSSYTHVATPKNIPTNRRLSKRLVFTAIGGGFGVILSIFFLYMYLLRALVIPFSNTTMPIQLMTYTPLSQISQPMQDATIAMEDGRFYHEGAFDWEAMHRALRIDVRDGKVEQGGSTITQQLAKNLFLSQDRTISRKLKEAAISLDLNALLSKRRILELYLNNIDYGMGCHGIVTAAAYYFHTTPAKLTLAQSAVLVGMVPNPPQPDPNFAKAGEAQYEDLSVLSQGEQTALGRIAYYFPGKYSEAQIDQAQDQPLDQLIYPYRDAIDRGAIDTIPAVWHGVGFYFFADPNEPTDINNVSPYLLPELAGFIEEAKRRYHLTGIDHLGVYNDRGMRQARVVLSAHAYGQAIDISGFRFADGSQLMVSDHDNSKLLSKLLAMEDLLKRHFDIVVDWKDDPLRHGTHFHCEVRGPRNEN